MAGSGHTTTYGGLDAGSNQLARLLRQRGLGTGDHVAILMENNAAFLTVAWGPQRSGLYYTAVDAHLTAPEVEYVLDDSGASALVTSYERRHVVGPLLERMPGVRTRLMVGGTIEGFEPYEAVVGSLPTTPLPGMVEGSDLLYSSGTTGRPKGVVSPLAMSPVGTPTRATLRLRSLYGLGPEGTFLSAGPLHHAGPLRFALAAQRIGCTVVVMERFDPVELLRAIERHGVTHVLLVPTMFVRLLRLAPEVRRRFDLSGLECAIHFAAPCPPAVKEQMIEWWGPIVHEFYSATEAHGFTSCDSEEWLRHRGTVGRPHLCRAHVVGEDGRELGAGQVGVVYFESDTRFEYHNDAEKTRAARNEQGWTTVGDLGFLDTEGYLYLTGRLAHTVICGGVNVHPQETENVLVGHPSVMDAAVFGVPDEEMGERVEAVVQPVDMAEAGPGLERELLSYCRAQLAPYKCPRLIHFEPELPRRPTGKLPKGLLQERFARPS